MANYNKNGQLIPDGEAKDFGTNTAETQKESNSKIKSKKKSAWESFLEGGRADENDPNLLASTGSGASIISDDSKKKALPKGSSSGTDTTPLSKGEQKQLDTSNDATRQEKAQIKEAADDARDYIRENDLTDIAEKAREKYDLYSGNVDSHYVDGLPRSIIGAYKAGKFGAVGSKDAKAIRNNLLLNEFGTMIYNMGSSLKNQDTKEGLWTSSVRKNMEEADKRNNEKFEQNMMNQINQLDLSAKEQIELEKHVNEIMADNTLAVAAKHANNIEDTLGLWHLKEALGSRWSEMTTKEKQSFLNAVNAIQSGDTASGKAILHSAFGDDYIADMQKQMTDYQLKQSAANAKMAETDANYRGLQNGVGVFNSVAGTIGQFIP